MPDSTDEAREALQTLATKVSNQLGKGLSAGTLIPQEIVVERWKLTGPLRYDDRGVPLVNRRSEQKREKTWAFAASKAAQEASQTEEYRIAEQKLASAYGIGGLAEQHLMVFTLRLAKTILETMESCRAAESSSLVSKFLDELGGTPVRCGADIDLQGIVLNIDRIEPTPGITIRQAVTDDFEGPVELGSGRFGSDPSSVMRIERIGSNPNDLQQELNRSIAIIRLFCVASVKWVCMRQFSESLVIPFSGMMWSGPQEVVNHAAQINPQNHRKLQSFWKRMDSCLPPDFSASPGAGSDYLAIAYERYSAALTRPALLEERIAQAVMALEAILINENLELAYKLRVRAAKLLSVLGGDAIQISRILKDAYGVRSTFAHGDRLSHKKTRKLDEQYKPASNLLTEILEILRKVLVTGILSRKGKDPLIDMIDDALIDQQHHAALENQLRSVRQCV